MKNDFQFSSATLALPPRGSLFLSPFLSLQARSSELLHSCRCIGFVPASAVRRLNQQTPGFNRRCATTGRRCPSRIHRASRSLPIQQPSSLLLPFPFLAFFLFRFLSFASLSQCRTSTRERHWEKSESQLITIENLCFC